MGRRLVHKIAARNRHFVAVRDPIGTLVVSMDCKYSGLNIHKMKQVQRRSSVVAGQHGAGALCTR